MLIVLGHSFGGYLLPKINERCGSSISKLIILAGNTRPLDTMALEQYSYLNAANPSENLKAEMDKLQQQIKFLNSRDFSLAASKNSLPLGLSAAYWKSLLDYNFESRAGQIRIPVLVLQGLRDYQVREEDFNNWKKILNSNPQALFISYQNLNHLFIEGTGKPTPEDYKIKGSVNQKVLADIGNFATQ